MHAEFLHHVDAGTRNLASGTNRANSMYTRLQVGLLSTLHPGIYGFIYTIVCVVEVKRHSLSDAADHMLAVCRAHQRGTPLSNTQLNTKASYGVLLKS